MNPTNTSGVQVPQGLDPVAYTLTKALAYQENGGQTPDYNAASGDTGATPDGSTKNGVGGGAYQYLPATWQARAGKYLGNANAPMTPDNQNQATYMWVAAQLKAGKTPAQIASMQNAGDGEPDAYSGKFSDGSSSAAGNYNVPQYVNNVQKYAEQIYSGVDPATGKPKPAYGYVAPPAPTPPAIVAGGEQPAGGGTPSLSGEVAPAPDMLPATSAGNIASNVGTNLSKLPGEVGDLAGKLLPILPDLINDVQGKDDKTALQQVGDAGLSALWFLPFGDIAEGAGLGAEALGLGAKAADTVDAAGNVVAGVNKTAQAAGQIATGAAAGYAGDVSNNLSQGKTDASALTPGLGTVLGVAAPVAGLAAGSLFNKFMGQQSAIDKITGAYEDAAGATKSGIAGMSKTAAKGLDPNPEFLANAGIMPETAEVNGRRVFTTGADSASQQTLTDRIGALSNVRDAAIDKSGAVVNIEGMRQSMLTQAEKDFSGTALNTAKAQINTEMDALAADPKYAQDADGNVQAADANKIKTYLQGRAKYDAATPAVNTQVFQTMGNVARGTVEDAAAAAGAPNIKAINKLIQQHYDAQNFLTKINGQTLKGGRLGTYVKEGVGAAIGGTLGSALGGGPIGTAAGTLAGYKGGELVSNWLQKLSVGGPMTAATLGRMASEDPEIVQEFSKYVGSEGGDKIAPVLKPAQASASSRVQSALNRTPGSRVFKGMSRIPKTVFGTQS